jgi:hypothetical protein
MPIEIISRMDFCKKALREGELKKNIWGSKKVVF